MVNSNIRNKLQWNRKRNSYIFIEEIALENGVWKMASILSRPQCVKVWHWDLSLEWKWYCPEMIIWGNCYTKARLPSFIESWKVFDFKNDVWGPEKSRIYISLTKIPWKGQWSSLQYDTSSIFDARHQWWEARVVYFLSIKGLNCEPILVFSQMLLILSIQLIRAWN